MYLIIQLWLAFSFAKYAVALSTSDVPEPLVVNCKDCGFRISIRDQTCDFETSAPYQICRCDSDCMIYGDCCLSVDDSCLDRRGQRGAEGNRTLFQCESVIIDRNSVIAGATDQYWMVSSCSYAWKERNRYSSEREELEDACLDTLNHRPPVTDLASGIVYKNEYCALCNDVSNIVVWNYNFVCNAALRDILSEANYTLTEELLNTYCTLGGFTEPILTDSVAPARPCYPQVETCLELNALPDSWSSSYYDALKRNCSDPASFQNHVIQAGNESIIYRNEYCALCNGFESVSIQCFLGPPNDATGAVGPSVPFSVLFDVYGNGRVVDQFTTQTTSIRVSCPEDGAVFDPVIEQCRSTLMQNCSNSPGNDDNNCTLCLGQLIGLTDPIEYVLVNASTLLYNEELYSVEYNIMTNGTPVICVNFTNDDIQSTIIFTVFAYPQVYLILTYIGCPLSIIGCVLIFLTHALFKELRTLPSQILIQLAVTILVGDLLILLSSPIIYGIDGADVLCTPTAIFTHYIFLAQFCWMSLMSTEIARTLYLAFRMKSSESNTYKTKLLVVYTLLGWCMPLVIVVITVIVNFTTTNLVLYGASADETTGSCWINHPESLYVSFLTPVMISLIYNTVLLIFVTVFLCVSSHSHSKVSKKKKLLYLRLNIAVFTISGVTWIFGFIALLPRLSWAWIAYIIFNSTRGLVIFMAFLCTKRVILLYRSLLFCRKEQSSTEGSSKVTLSSAKGSRKSNNPLA